MEASTASGRPARAAAMPRLASPRLLRVASDERLVALVRSGNEPAFETLYDRHHRPLLSFCRHMLGDRGESEDAVQQTFLAAYNDLVSSSKPIQLRAWLFAIARNRCLSMLRARREQATGEELEVATEGLAEEVQRRSDLKELLGDMRELPDDQRAALVLAEIGALSHDEIAEVLDVPRQKVKALVFQARESLIATRNARDVSCEQIREELATARGGALRRAPLRRHLRECEGCREFRAHVDRQRAALAIVLPVIPTAALKFGAMPAAVTAKLSAGAGSAGGGIAAAGAKGVAAKFLAVAALTGAGAAGTAAVVHELNHPPAKHDNPVIVPGVHAAVQTPSHASGDAHRVHRSAAGSSASARAAHHRHGAGHHGRHRHHGSSSAQSHRSAAVTPSVSAQQGSSHAGHGRSAAAAGSSHRGSGGASTQSHGHHVQSHPVHPMHPVHPVHPSHAVHPPHPTHPPHPVPPRHPLHPPHAG
jgi:RNA polymerase sigma factor (sigma-70 family)